VRCGNRDAPVERERADGVVEHLGPDHADVHHVRAAVRGAADGRLRHRGRRQPHVTADGDRLRLELLDVGAADRVGALLVELGRIEAPDVVGLEDLWVEHAGPMLRRRAAELEPLVTA
jgi:hypothetical protein